MRHYEQFVTFTRGELPSSNRAVFRGCMGLDDFVGSLRYQIDQLHREIEASGGLATMSLREARQTLKVLDFWLGSTERHFQSAGRPPGSGLSVLGVEPLLVQLGEIARHPPKGSAYTRWVWNLENLTFTGDPQEHLFDDVTRVTHGLVEDAADAMRPIASGDVGVEDPRAATLLSRAAALIEREHAEFRRLDANAAVAPEDVRFTPEFFAFEMRTYLPTYAIGGKRWGGVSAANLAAFWSADFLLGTVTNSPSFNVQGVATDYRGLVLHKAENVPFEVRQQLLTDIEQKSVAARIFDHLGLDLEHDAVDPTSITATPVIVAFARVVKAWGSSAAYHLALIKSHLEKAAEKLPPEVRQKLAVDPSVGSGGMGLHEVRQITLMRAQHPILRPFANSVRDVDARSAA